MADSFSLGRHGKYGEIDFSKLKSGITKKDLGIEEGSVLASIFDSINTNKDGDSETRLDRQELVTFLQKVKELAGNQRLSKREAKKYKINGEKLDKNSEELINFINKLANLTIGVKNVQKSEEINKSELVTYDDGHTEEIFPDGSMIITVFDGGKTTTTKKDKNGKITEEIVKEGDSEVKTEYTNSGKKVTKTTPDATEIVQYDTNGSPKAKKTTDNTTRIIEEFVFENGKPILKRKTDPQNNQVITYDGTKETIVTNKDGVKTTVVKDNGAVIQQKEVKTNENNQVETKDIIYDGNNLTENFYVDDVQKYQRKVVDGKEYRVNYDENGNTTGVVVQYGETPSAIAKRFGCTLEELADANKDKLKGKGKNARFAAGEEIVIPGKLDADAKALQGRKSKSEVLEQVKKEEERRILAELKRKAAIEAQRRARAEAEKQEKAYYRKLGVKDFKGKGTKVTAHGWGNKQFEVIGSLDYQRRLVKLNGKLYTMSHDGRILREDYIEAHRAFVSLPKNQRKNTASGMSEVTYVKDSNGKIWYFNERTGKAYVKDGYKNIVKREAEVITNQLTTASKGMGTDEELLEKGVKNIYSKDILKEVNDQLKTKDKDFKGDAQTMPVEALMFDEMSHTAARPLIKTLINSGAMSIHEQANSIKREIEYEVNGGLIGYTSTADLNEAMQLCNNREVRIEIENKFKKDYPNLPENDGSVVRAYLAKDGWNAQEVDQFDANWIKTGAYQEARYDYKRNEKGEVEFDEKGNPIIIIVQGDQAHRDKVIGRLVFDYNNKEALNKGLDVLNDNPNSFDYKNLEKRAKEKVNTDPNGKYKSRFTDQDNIQRYLAGFHLDETGNVDLGNLSASNTCLFKSGKPARIQAEEALYGAKNGDFSQAFDSLDAEMYVEMSKLIKDGNIAGINNMTELYKKALADVTNPNDKIKIKANAMISGQVDFTDEEIIDFCVELMHTIDSNRGHGGSTGTSARYTNTADYQTEQLKFILQNNPQIMDKVKERINKDNFSYTTSTQMGGGVGQQPTYSYQTTNTKDSYLQLLTDTKNIVQEEIFYDENGNIITDPQQIENIKQLNLSSLEEMRKYVAELEREFKKGVDAEGNLSDAANYLSEFSGIGTDREDIATEYRNARLLLQQFEAAAKGRLRDSSGKVISLRDLTQQIVNKQDALVAANSDYKQTIAYGKMGIVLAPVIVVTSAATGGAGAVGLGTVGTAIVGGTATGLATYGMGAYEYNTSYTGNTAEAREANFESSAVAAAATTIGIAQMKYINNLKSGFNQYMATSAADIAVDTSSEYLVNGDLTIEGVASTAIFSVVGNLIGADAAKREALDVDAPNLPRPSVDDVVADYNAAGNMPREAGRQTRNRIADNEQFVEIGKRRVDIATANEAELRDARRRVAQWADGTRNKQELLDLIDGRLNNPNPSSVSPSSSRTGAPTAETPTRPQEVKPEVRGRSTEVVDALNQSTAEQAARILSKNGHVTPEEFALLETHLVNNLKTPEQVEEFIQQIRNRVGVNDKGNMHVIQVEGKDYGAMIINKAIAQKNKIKANLADFNNVQEILNNVINNKKGLNAQEMASIQAFVNKAESVEELQIILEQLNKVKKSDATRALKKHIEKQIELRRTPADVDVNEPAVRTETEEPVVRTDNNSGNITDDQYIDMPDGRRIRAEINPNNPNEVAIATINENGTTTVEWIHVDELSELGLEVDPNGNVRPRSNHNSEVEVRNNGEDDGAIRTEDGVRNNGEDDAAVSTDGEVRNNGEDDAAVRTEDEVGVDGEVAVDGEVRVDGEVGVDGVTPIADRRVFSIAKEKVDALLEMLPTKQLKQATNLVIEKIKSLKTLADYNTLKTKVNTMYAKYSDVKTQLLKWLDEKLESLHLLKPSPQADDVKFNGSNIESQYRRNGTDFNPNELVRTAGNNGNPINENYVHASKDLRRHYQDAIANGTYADSYQSYVNTMTSGHRVAYGGFDGNHTWYGEAGEGHNNIDAGQIRGEETSPRSDRKSIGQTVEVIASKYGDPYNTTGLSQVKLKGISYDAQPVNRGTAHHYPDGKYLDQYFVQMHRTAQEALDLIRKGAPQDEILAKLAEHYQYAANARPFGQINNSLFMNEINTLLEQAGMKPMPHGMLDHVAQRLQPDTFKQYFIDEYKRTALDLVDGAVTSSGVNVEEVLAVEVISTGAVRPGDVDVDVLIPEVEPLLANQPSLQSSQATNITNDQVGIWMAADEGIVKPDVKMMGDDTPVRPETSAPTTNRSSLDEASSVHSTTGTDVFAQSGLRRNFEIPENSVKNLLNKVPDKLKQATNLVIEKIKSLKTLADYNTLKSQINVMYDKYQDVKTQLLKWLDEKLEFLNFNENSNKNKIKVLLQIKDSAGNLKYSLDEIGNIIKINQDVPVKTLKALLNLEDWHAPNEISEILSFIKTPEDIRILDLLLDTDGIATKNMPAGSEVGVDYLDILAIFKDKSSEVTGLDDLILRLLKDDVASLLNEPSNGVALRKLVGEVKTPMQKTTLGILIDRIKLHAPQPWIESWHLECILHNIDSKYDYLTLLSFLDNYLDSRNATCQAIQTYAQRMGDPWLSVDHRNLMKEALANLSKANFTAWEVDDIMGSLKYVDYDDFNPELLFNLMKQNRSASVLEFAAQLTNTTLNSDTPLMNYIRKFGIIPEDAVELKKITFNNELEKEAFSFLLQVNGTGERFEALAFDNIIRKVNTEQDLLKLKKMLLNDNLDTHTIIKNLEMVDDNGMVNVEIPKDGIGQGLGLQIEHKYGKLEILQKVRPKQYKKIVDSGLLELIEEGKISASILDNIDENSFLSNRTLNAIKKIKNGEPLIKVLTYDSDFMNISQHVSNGEVCEFNGRLYVNDDGTPVEIKMSKEKFEQLFPPFETVTFKQGDLGNCYFVTTLDNCIDLPMGRVALYKLFEQKGDDIYITFPNSDKSIKFEKGQPAFVSNRRINAKSTSIAPGVQMIEQAYAVHRLKSGSRAYTEDCSVTDMADLVNVEELMLRLKGGWQYEVVKDIFGQDITLNSYGKDLDNRKAMKELIISTANDPNTLTFFATKKTPGGDRAWLAQEYDLAGSHAYSIKAYNEETGMVYITNPWHTSIITEVPLFDLIKYIDDVNIARFTNS